MSYEGLVEIAKYVLSLGLRGKNATFLFQDKLREEGYCILPTKPTMFNPGIRKFEIKGDVMKPEITMVGYWVSPI